MAKIIISENQFNLLTKKLMSEAVGVPDYILDSGEKLYDVVSNYLKRINRKEDNYKGFITTQLPVGDMVFETIMLDVRVNELEDYDGEAVIASAGVGNAFRFDNAILMQINQMDRQIDLHLNFIVSENWEWEDLYNAFTKDKIHNVSVMAHELKHKYDRQKKEIELAGGTADYQAYSRGNLNFGVPVLNKFMRFSYFIQNAENLVRPTEVASRMTQKKIKREEFYDFITNDDVYKELKEEMDYVDGLIEHAGWDPSQMSEAEKIKSVLELVYINLVNSKLEIFDDYIYDMHEKAAQLFGQIGMKLGLFGSPANEEKEKVKQKYMNHVIKYQNREMDFFKDECDRFNYVSTKLIKRLSKIYSLLSESKIQEEENCIINWDLYHEMREKKYGKRKIQTDYIDELKNIQTPKNGLNLSEKDNTKDEDKKELPSGGKVTISDHNSIPNGRYYFWKDRSGGYQVSKSYQARDNSYSIGERTLKKYLGI